ncbi:hypothetical protein HPB51_021554 [Rhipicephalus microplus]|uniref:RING-CH-type domain-containing protein n=1 Tax=Rhipicephalus microplus TaxID=6941 RepID=A0A9J6EJ83_RHIMP|nr:E3 ubiquitin-protein ligase MARCHF1-like [Rhipicephalus microplus]KAH8034164.1 hypothetical protein HPB51_021554 [Rhipicephalus microplus]
MSFFVNAKVVDSVEARANEEIELDVLSRGSTTTEDTSTTEKSADERENGEVNLVNQDGGMEDDTTSTTSSTSSAERSSRVSDATTSTSFSHTDEAERAMAHLSCRLCSEDGSAPEEPLYRCPCRCTDTFVHRSCLEQLLYQGLDGGVCPVCDTRYPVRRQTKPLWLSFWDKESREDAFLFLAYMVFNLGNIGVITMAWMYVLFEFGTKSWLPTSSLASALFIFSVFWIGFGCLRLSVRFMTLVQWRRDNTTLKVLFTDKVDQA